MVSASDVPRGIAAIELRGVVKDFAVGLRGVKLRAVDGLNLRVMPGEIYGLLGPNGSGKSTAIKLMLGLLTPSAGTATIFGQPSSRAEARSAVGYLPEAPDFYRCLTGRELVRFYGRLCDMSGAPLETRIAAVLAQVGLSGDAANRRVVTYSKGMLQRIGIAQAIVHDPRLVILDEPTAGLDPMGVAAISELIVRLKAEGKAVLVTSHLLGQIEEICDRVAILRHGRLILEGSMREIFGQNKRPASIVEGLAPEHFGELQTWLAQRGARLQEAPLPRTRLDKLFLERVSGSDRS